MITKTTEQTKLAILRKTPYAHSTRPSDEGMPAQQVKRLFYSAIADQSNSVLSEMERMRQEANDSLDTKTNVAMQTDDVETNCDSAHYPSTLAVQRYLDQTGHIYRLYFSNLSVPQEAWEQLTEAIGDYTHFARVALPNVTAAMVPDVYFAPADVARPQIATFAYCEDGALLLYATQALTGAVQIQTLVCSLPACFSVLIDAQHADVTVQDSYGKTYRHGDFVAIGALLTVTIAPGQGYTLSSVSVNGTAYTGNSVQVPLTVDGTVQVTVQATLGEVE